MQELTAIEVQSALKAWLGEPGVVEVSREDPNGSTTGLIMHPDFTGISHATRQAWLWDGFEQGGILKQWQGLLVGSRERSAQIGLFYPTLPLDMRMLWQISVV